MINIAEFHKCKLDYRKIIHKINPTIYFFYFITGSTDAARAAADIVLTEPGLSTIVHGILIARCIFIRIRNFITYRIAATLQLLLFFFIAIFAFRPSGTNIHIYYLCIYVSICMYVCICVCMYVCMYISLYLCVYILYVFIHNQKLFC